jgi:hypothetical protein
VSYDKELLRQLCERASKEQDPEKVLELTAEILRLSDPKRPEPPPPDNNV